jgi:MFS family permease
MSEQSARARDGWRNVRAFGLTSFLNDTASEMAYWVLPAFLVTLGAGPAQLGIIEGIAESIASIAKLFSGMLADRFARRKPLVVSGYIAANAVKPLLALTTSWWQILGIRFVDRFAKGIRGTPRDVMVADSVEKDRIGSAYGLIQAMDSAGAIAGPLAALVLLSRVGMRGVFWAAAVPGFLCVLVAIIWIREGQSGTKEARVQEDQQTSGTKNAIADTKAAVSHLPGSFYFVLFVVTLFSLGNSSDMFLVLRAQNLGIAARYAPLLGLVFNIVYTATSWPAGNWSDKVPRRVIAAAGYAVFALVYLVFAWAPSKTAIWIAMAFYGLFYALTNPVLKALVVDTAPASLKGRALGFYFFATSVAMLLASVITGELWKHMSPALPFYVSAGLGVVSTILLLAVKEDAKKPTQAEAN